MTVRIIKPKPIQTCEDFLEEFQFKEIPYQEFKILTKKLRPLRQHTGTKLYGFRSDSRIKGISTTYLIMINTKTFKTTLAAGATNIIWQEITKLKETGKWYVKP